MLKTLIKVGLSSITSSMFRTLNDNKQRQTGMKILFILLFAYVGAVFCGMFGFLFYTICVPFHTIQVDWLYFGMTVILAAMLMFVGSVFMTQKLLFSSTDNELLLSMPIKPKYILLSRLFSLLVVNAVYEALVVLPAAAVYAYLVGFTATGLIGFILIFLLLPLFVMALTTAFAYCLQLISSRFKKKTFISLVFSMAFLGAYFYGYSQINTLLAYLVQNGNSIAGSIRSAAAPVYWMGSAIASGNLLYLLVSVLVLIVPFMLLFYILSATFIRLITTKKSGNIKAYSAKPMHQNSMLSALYKKEMTRFWSCSAYVLNSGLGVFIMLGGAVYLLIQPGAITSLLAQLPGLDSLKAPAAVLAMCLIVSTCQISAPSISLEGKNLWIPRSMPVPTKTFLTSKVLVHLTLVIPATVIAGVVLAVLLKTSLPETLLILIVPALYAYLNAVFGVIVNVYMPKLDWVSEVIVVKQSGSVGVAMLTAMGMPFVLGGVYFALSLIMPGILALLMVAVILALLCYGARYFLFHTGVNKLERITCP